jgi:hypothetical protein
VKQAIANPQENDPEAPTATTPVKWPGTRAQAVGSIRRALRQSHALLSTGDDDGRGDREQDA